jgi:hypothetical protein
MIDKIELKLVPKKANNIMQQVICVKNILTMQQRLLVERVGNIPSQTSSSSTYKITSDAEQIRR